MELDGESTYQKAYTLRNPLINPSVVNIPDGMAHCCSDYSLKVLADATGLPLQNDVSTVCQLFDGLVSAVTLKLKKYVDGAWADQATITDNTYGTFIDLGDFINPFGQQLVSLEVNWSVVLANKGEGVYRFTFEYTAPIFGSSEIDGYEYCLKTYTPDRANGTVRLEYWLSGTTGDIEDDTKIKDFGSQVIYNSLRLRGFFGYPKASYKEDSVEYETGQSVFVEDEQSPVYKMKLRPIPFFIHEILRTDFMMADTLAVTDYNSRNNGSYVQKYVRKDSGYEPKWYELKSDLAPIELQFKPQFNRFRKFRD